MMNYLYELPPNFVVIAQRNHQERLTEDGIYTEQEITNYVLNLPSQKICDLEDSLDAAIYDYIRLFQSNEIKSNETYYNLFDLQDYRDSRLKTFEEAKEWLIIFWNDNPNEEMFDGEHDKWISQIAATTDVEQLNEMLHAIDYALEKLC